MNTAVRRTIGALALAAGLAAPASASAVTLGSVVPEALNCWGPNLIVDEGSGAPSAGTLTSFSHAQVAGSSGQEIEFKVLRPAEDSNYMVIGTSGVKRLPGDSGVATFPVTPIAIQAGDVLAFWYPQEGIAACGTYRYDVAHPNGYVSMANPGIGAVVPVYTWTGNFDQNIAAEFTAVGLKPCAAETRAYDDSVAVREAAFLVYGDARSAQQLASATYYGGARTEERKAPLVTATAATDAARAEFVRTKDATLAAYNARMVCLGGRTVAV